MVPATTSLTGFSGETIWPLGQLRFLVIIRDANHSTRAWMNFMIVRSLSPYNDIIGRPRIRAIQEEVAIEGTLSDKGHTELCSILKKNLDIFAWQPSDMRGVLQSVVEHRFNIREGYSSVRKKKRGQALGRAKAIHTEVQKLVEVGIMREVYYHDWLSNPVMSLNGKLASLNRFLSKSAKQSLPLFQTLKKCIKKSDFYWTAEAEQAVKQLKQHLSELPLLVAPKPKEELIIYLSTTYGAISVVLMTERRTIQTPIYFINHALQGPELNYTQMEKLVLSLVFAAKRLQRYFQAHPITAKNISQRTDLSRFSHRDAGLKPTSRASDKNSTGAFEASNNEAEYEALIDGLRIAARMGVKNVHVSVDSKLVANQVLGTYVAKEDNMVKYLEIVKSLAEYLIREIHEGSCSMHAGPRSVVAKSIQLGYYWPTMHRDARDMIRKCDGCQIHRPITRSPQQPLTPITALWLFYKWGIDIAGPFLEGTVSDNGKQFSDNPFKDWCDKLNITQRFALVKHPQFNGLVERANRSLGEGIKACLGEENKNWVEELLHVLWAHRTMIKSSHGDTPFSLTYGTEAVIPTKIEMPTYRTAAVDLSRSSGWEARTKVGRTLRGHSSAERWSIQIAVHG
uniref:Reverse transcriptase domain-containing protein n=1 Tax=Tanacetum cinerariifolium TaxID=118510 RepID=A0A6L2JBH5_TANCI|nr:reverse transcriptase domain-containing protein [Tanacetum cinerariifolium]